MKMAQMITFVHNAEANFQKLGELMYKIESLWLNPGYDNSLAEHNLDIVGYVVEKITNKVVDTAVVKRSSLASWYENRRAKFVESRFTFLIASLSIIGEINGVQFVDSSEKSNSANNSDSVEDECIYRGKKVTPKVH